MTGTPYRYEHQDTSVDIFWDIHVPNHVLFRVSQNNYDNFDMLFQIKYIVSVTENVIK
jgi:hypothetical protein